MAKRTWPRPDKDETLELLKSLDERYEKDLAILAETRALRERTWSVNVPQELKDMVGADGLEYHDPTIAEDLGSLPTLYTSKFPSLECKADQRAGEKTVDDLTTRLEYHTTAALFEECGCRSIGPPTHERLYEGVFSGSAVTMLVKRRDRWADYDAVAAEGYDAEHRDGPRKGERKYRDADDYGKTSEETKKRCGVPIDWRYVDPMTVRPQFEGDELVEVIEVQERDLIDCLTQYNLGLDDAGHVCPGATAVVDWTKRAESRAKVRFIQRWNPIWCQYVVAYGGGSWGGSATAESSYEVRAWRHRYGLGRPPYFITLGGKTKDYEFARLATSHASEHKVDLVKAASQGRTILGYLAIRDAIPILYETTPPDGMAQLEGDTGKPKAPTPYKLGTKMVGQPGATLTAVTFPDVGTKLQAEVIQIEERLRRMGPTEVTGSLQGAGEAIATSFERDRARVNREEAAIVRHLTEVTLAFWKLEASLDEPVYVFRAADKKSAGYVKVEPDDFKTAVRPIWTLHVDSMAADMIREQYLSRRVENRTMGDDQSIELQGSNVLEVQKARAKAAQRESPDYQATLAAEITARWGRDWMPMQALSERMAGAAAAGAVNPNQAVAPQGLAVPPGANGQTSAGVSIAAPPGATVPPGVPPGTPAPPSVQTGAATAGVHGGAPLG